MRAPIEKHPPGFADIRAVLDGERHVADKSVEKLLRFFLERSSGCDVEITADEFVVRFGWHPSRHFYKRRLARGVLCWLLELSNIVGPIGSMVFDVPAASFPTWSFGRRRVWLTLENEKLELLVRDAQAIVPPGERPARLDCPRRERRELTLAAPAHCPHCGTLDQHFRLLRDNSLVCNACGRSTSLSKLR